ncbi:MAG: hypothetical protein V1797_19120 [Pseudomonadota bacterium]
MSPPPPTPGWAYGAVQYSVQFESGLTPNYRVTMAIKSPATIWFRYIYKEGPGPRWYQVTSGHQPRCFQSCVAIEAFGDMLI